MESSFNKKIGNIYYLLTMLLLFCIPIEPLIGKLYKLLKILYIFIFIIFFFSWRKKRNVNIYYLIFSIFVFLACFSIIYTGHKQSSISMAQELILNFLLALGISFKIRVNNDLENANSEIEKYFYSFSFGTFVITLYLLIFELPNLGRWTRLGQELYSNYGSYMVYSYCEIISMTYLIWNLFLTEKKEKKNRFLSLIMLVVLLIGALVSGTRKSLICPILFLVFALFIKYKNKFGKLCISFLIASIFVFLGYKVMLSNQVFYERIGVRIENMITSITTKESDEGSINERALLRDLSLDLFKKKPIIGYGLHAFRYYSINNGGPYLYAHCNYTELLADLGIVGFSLYYFAYMYLVFLAIKEYKNKKFSLYIISFMLMNIIADYGTVSYYRHYYLIFYVMFATYLKIENNKVKIECEKK